MRAQRDRHLKVLVRASFAASKHRYGSPRIHEDLLEHERVSRKRVIRLMQEDGLKARVRKRLECTTMSDHDQPVAGNLLDRQSSADAPNRRWVGDTTEFVIGESGKLYLAAILDLFSRFVVGWAISAGWDARVDRRRDAHRVGGARGQGGNGGYVDRVRVVLTEDPSRAQAVSRDGYTPLWWLPDDEAKAMEIAELLLAAGADAAAKNKDGRTAADWARRRGMRDVASRLEREPGPRRSRK